MPTQGKIPRKFQEIIIFLQNLEKLVIIFHVFLRIFQSFFNIFFRAVVILLNDSMRHTQENYFAKNLSFFLEISVLFNTRIHILYNDNDTKYMLMDVARAVSSRVKKANLFTDDHVIRFNDQKLDSILRKVVEKEQKFQGCRDGKSTRKYTD